MINTQHLFVQMPLMQVYYPANAKMYCDYLNELVSLKLIDTDAIWDKMLISSGT